MVGREMYGRLSETERTVLTERRGRCCASGRPGREDAGTADGGRRKPAREWGRMRGLVLLGVWEAEADGNASSSRGGEERWWWWVECVIVGRLGGFGEKGFLHEHRLSLPCNLLCR
jgi:hypothetical protein